MICDDLEGWNVEGGGRLMVGDVYILIADSLCCTAETNTILQNDYTPVKERERTRAKQTPRVSVSMFLQSKQQSAHTAARAFHPGLPPKFHPEKLVNCARCWPPLPRPPFVTPGDRREGSRATVTEKIRTTMDGTQSI